MKKMDKIFVLGQGVLKELIRRKDLYLIIILLLVIVLYAASFSFGGESGFHRYFKEVGISFTYIFSVIIGIMFAARQIPQEVESKTIYPLLARPLSRLEFILGKFFGVFFVTIVSFSIFYLVFIASLFMRGDFTTPPILLAEGYILHAALLSFFVSLAILLSLFLSTLANMVISVILYFGTNWFGATFPAYIFLPHPELFDIKEKIIHTQDIVPLWVMVFLVVYAAVYTALFLTLAYAAFRRRDL
jgi:ABC-type transport system involved in multi-copper enzyme maturation permease subunit